MHEAGIISTSSAAHNEKTYIRFRNNLIYGRLDLNNALPPLILYPPAILFVRKTEEHYLQYKSNILFIVR